MVWQLALVIRVIFYNFRPDATEYLFRIDTSTVTRQGAVYKEFLSPHDIPSPRTARKRLELRGEEVENLSPLPSPRGDVVTINNLTSIVSDGSEVDINTHDGYVDSYVDHDGYVDSFVDSYVDHDGYVDR